MSLMDMFFEENSVLTEVLEQMGETSCYHDFNLEQHRPLELSRYYHLSSFGTPTIPFGYYASKLENALQQKRYSDVNRYIIEMLPTFLTLADDLCIKKPKGYQHPLGSSIDNHSQQWSDLHKYKQVVDDYIGKRGQKCRKILAEKLNATETHNNLDNGSDNEGDMTDFDCLMLLSVFSLIRSVMDNVKLFMEHNRHYYTSYDEVCRSTLQLSAFDNVFDITNASNWAHRLDWIPTHQIQTYIDNALDYPPALFPLVAIADADNITAEIFKRIFLTPDLKTVVAFDIARLVAANSTKINIWPSWVSFVFGSKNNDEDNRLIFLTALFSSVLKQVREHYADYDFGDDIDINNNVDLLMRLMNAGFHTLLESVFLSELQLSPSNATIATQFIQRYEELLQKLEQEGRREVVLQFLKSSLNDQLTSDALQAIENIAINQRLSYTFPEQLLDAISLEIAQAFFKHYNLRQYHEDAFLITYARVISLLSPFFLMEDSTYQNIFERVNIGGLLGMHVMSLLRDLDNFDDELSGLDDSRKKAQHYCDITPISNNIDKQLLAFRVDLRQVSKDFTYADNTSMLYDFLTNQLFSSKFYSKQINHSKPHPEISSILISSLYELLFEQGGVLDSTLRALRDKNQVSELHAPAVYHLASSLGTLTPIALWIFYTIQSSLEESLIKPASNLLTEQKKSEQSELLQEFIQTFSAIICNSSLISPLHVLEIIQTHGQGVFSDEFLNKIKQVKIDAKKQNVANISTQANTNTPTPNAINNHDTLDTKLRKCVEFITRLYKTYRWAIALLVIWTRLSDTHRHVPIVRGQDTSLQLQAILSPDLTRNIDRELLDLLSPIFSYFPELKLDILGLFSFTADSDTDQHLQTSPLKEEEQQITNSDTNAPQSDSNEFISFMRSPHITIIANLLQHYKGAIAQSEKHSEPPNNDNSKTPNTANINALILQHYLASFFFSVSAPHTFLNKIRYPIPVIDHDTRFIPLISDIQPHDLRPTSSNGTLHKTTREHTSVNTENGAELTANHVHSKQPQIPQSSNAAQATPAITSNTNRHILTHITPDMAAVFHTETFRLQDKYNFVITPGFTFAPFHIKNSLGNFQTEFMTSIDLLKDLLNRDFYSKNSMAARFIGSDTIPAHLKTAMNFQTITTFFQHQGTLYKNNPGENYSSQILSDAQTENNNNNTHIARNNTTKTKNKNKRGARKTKSMIIDAAFIDTVRLQRQSATKYIDVIQPAYYSPDDTITFIRTREVWKDELDDIVVLGYDVISRLKQLKQSGIIAGHSNKAKAQMAMDTYATAMTIGYYMRILHTLSHNANQLGITNELVAVLDDLTHVSVEITQHLDALVSFIPVTSRFADFAAFIRTISQEITQQLYQLFLQNSEHGQ